MCKNYSKQLFMLSLAFFFSFGAISSFSEPQMVASVEGQQIPENFISGSGSHFTWILFNELQADLEKHIGRPIKLHGKDSMYGVGCKAGIKIAKKNSIEMETFGFSCCPLSDEEVAKNGLDTHPIAWEPIYIIINSSNPIKNLSVEQVRGVFSGEIKNWKEVGGPDKNIVVVTRNHCGKRPGHWKKILPNKKAFREDRMKVKGAEPMVRTVSDFSNSIGHVGSGWQAKPTDKIKVIKVGGINPTPENLAAKKYPFYRLLSVITHGKLSPSIQGILDFMQNSNEFERVAKKYNMLKIQNGELTLKVD